MLIANVFLFLIFQKYTKDKVEAYIYGSAIFTLYLFLSAEVLSFFKGITFLNLWLVFVGLDILLLILAFKLKVWSSVCSTVKSIFSKKALLFLMFSVVMIILAIKIVPYNWDSMTYHIARVFHWEQNQSIAHYASSNDRQAASPILGDLINLYVYVMSGTKDVFLNLMQCFSFLANGILVYYITKKLGGGRYWRMLAATLFFTSPIAFAEALTTQVDNFAAFWMLCFVYLLLDFVNENKKLEFDKKSIIKVCMLAGCVAFGYCSKPSVCVAMLVFVVWLLIVSIKRRDKISVIIKLLSCMLPVFAVIMIPELYRNFLTFDAFSPQGVGARQIVGTINPRYLAVNGLKNFTFNMPNGWLMESELLIKKTVVLFSRLLCVDLNHPAISEDGREFVVIGAHSYDCDSAVNPIIVFLFMFTVLMYIINFRKKLLKNNTGGGYYKAAGVSFIIFCIILRWEAFVSRYMISYLAILCPALAISIEILVKNSKKSQWGNYLKGVIYFLCLTELCGLLIFYGNFAIDYSRKDGKGYFASRKTVYEGYKEITEYINDEEFKNIGLYIGGNSYEYPFTVMLDSYERIEHINVENNPTKKYEDFNFVPDAIVVVDQKIEDKEMICHNSIYIKVKEIEMPAKQSSSNIYLYKRQ